MALSLWLLYQRIRSGTANSTGAGSAIGDAIASATGASLFASTGTATGDAVATGIGASLFDTAGTAAGDAVAAAVGASLFDSTGTAVGDAVASAVGTSLFASTGTAVGDAVCAGVIEDATPAVVVTPEIAAVTNIGVGRAAWRNWYRSTLPKKKRKLVDELDEMIEELQARVIAPEVSGFDEEIYQRTLRVSQALASSQDIASIADARIREQIVRLKEAIDEIDDEEAILLAFS